MIATITVTAPKGTILNCEHPAAVDLRIGPCQRVVDLVHGALAQGVPERVIAACNGAVNSFTWSPVSPVDHYALRRASRTSVTGSFTLADVQSVAGGTTAAYDVPSSPDGKTYKYTVVAIDTDVYDVHVVPAPRARTSTR